MSRQKLPALLAELATLRNRAERVCLESEALRKTYRLAIEETRCLLHSNKALSPERDPHQPSPHPARAKTDSDSH